LFFQYFIKKKKRRRNARETPGGQHKIIKMRYMQKDKNKCIIQNTKLFKNRNISVINCEEESDRAEKIKL